MRAGIHPEYEKALITCACGRVTETRSTVGEIHVEICSHCHPFFTGRQKLVDTAGRVERFIAKYGREGQPSPEAASASEADGPPAAEKAGATEGAAESSPATDDRPEAESAADDRPEAEPAAGDHPEADEEEEAAAVDS